MKNLTSQQFVPNIFRIEVGEKSLISNTRNTVLEKFNLELMSNLIGVCVQCAWGVCGVLGDMCVCVLGVLGDMCV